MGAKKMSLKFRFKSCKTLCFSEGFYLNHLPYVNGLSKKRQQTNKQTNGLALFCNKNSKSRALTNTSCSSSSATGKPVLIRTISVASCFRSSWVSLFLNPYGNIPAQCALYLHIWCMFLSDALCSHGSHTSHYSFCEMFVLETGIHKARSGSENLQLATEYQSGRIKY